MDLASIIGLIGCAVAIVYGIVSGDQGWSALPNFYDLNSILITVGGSLTCMLTMASDFKDYLNSWKSMGIILKKQTSSEGDVIHKIIELANIARKEGLLQLEEAAEGIEDEFFKKGVMLIVDGTDQELVSSIMETDLGCVERRHSKIIGFWEGLSAMGPAWGMIGTLIGLINMLKMMDDPGSIGPNMAIALITTLYGSMIANWIALPIASKLKAISSQEVILKEVVIEGILSIQAGENPRVIEEKLKSFLAPNVREAVLGGDKEQGGEE